MAKPNTIVKHFSKSVVIALTEIQSRYPIDAETAHRTALYLSQVAHDTYSWRSIHGLTMREKETIDVSLRNERIAQGEPVPNRLVRLFPPITDEDCDQGVIAKAGQLDGYLQEMRLAGDKDTIHLDSMSNVALQETMRVMLGWMVAQKVTSTTFDQLVQQFEHTTGALSQDIPGGATAYDVSTALRCTVLDAMAAAVAEHMERDTPMEWIEPLLVSSFLDALTDMYGVQSMYDRLVVERKTHI